MKKFFRLVMRTVDVRAAKDFYTSILGDGPMFILPLHENAIARGARPHWLGLIDVDNVDEAGAMFLSRGANARGPKWVDAEGLEAWVMHDPGGAIIGLAKPTDSMRIPDAQPIKVGAAEVVLYQLNTTAVDGATANYGQLCDWEFQPARSVGDLGLVHPFAFTKGGRSVGFMNDIAQRPGVHSHWLFHFRVPNLESAMATVRDAGGLVLPVFSAENGDRVAVCDDPQGAAFAMREVAKQPA